MVFQVEQWHPHHASCYPPPELNKQQRPACHALPLDHAVHAAVRTRLTGHGGGRGSHFCQLSPSRVVTRAADFSVITTTPGTERVAVVEPPSLQTRLLPGLPSHYPDASHVSRCDPRAAAGPQSEAADCILPAPGILSFVLDPGGLRKRAGRRR